MKIITDLKEARSGLLRRVPLELEEAPDRVKERIKDSFGGELTPQQVVEQIVREVRLGGDKAVFEYARRIDGVELDSLEVTQQEIVLARNAVSQELVAALNFAAERIRAFHNNCKRQSWIDFGEGGLGQRVYPLQRVGLYVPGGTAAYPSTVLMAAIPARVAGVGEIIVTSPAPRGSVHPATLVAADIAQVDRVFKVGGAQAIAALAFGTETIPRVDKICGPGNIFTQLAKKLVYGAVDIDGLYGPTELVIVADETADPVLCAADLLAQAEHDELASPILITNSLDLAEEVKREFDQQAARSERGFILSTQERSGIVVVEDLQQAVELVNDYAPEHLSLQMSDPWSYLDKVRNAGAVFLGEDSPEVLGDYVAGPSHVLPTGGTARFGSPLTSVDFLKATSVVALNNQTLRKIGPSAAIIAHAEGLSGHAHAVEIRLDRGQEGDDG